MINDTYLKLFKDNKINCATIEEISINILGSRKKLYIFLADSDVIFINPNKSRILKKHIDEFEKFIEQIKNLKNVDINNKFLFFHSPICSKAKEYAQENAWKVLYVSL